MEQEHLCKGDMRLEQCRYPESDQLSGDTFKREGCFPEGDWVRQYLINFLNLNSTSNTSLFHPVWGFAPRQQVRCRTRAGLDKKHRNFEVVF